MMYVLKKIIDSTPKIISGFLLFTTVLSFCYIPGATFSVAKPSVAEAALNRQINYQGKLTNASNVAVADGTYHMMFKLYTVATGGSPIWTEDRSTAAGDRITISNGVFSAMLGSSTPLSTVDFNQTLYLGVEIGGSSGSPSWDGEMTPRKVLGVVPSAIESDKLDSLSSEQFLRTDATNSTSTASTFLSVVQTGAGKIAEFFGVGLSSVLSLMSSGNVGIGTTTPYAKLSVVGETVSSYFTATTSTASTFPYASTTALTVSGTGGLQLATGLNGSLQAVNGLVSASSTLSIAFGGTGLSTAPTYGQILLGTSAGGYSLAATSSLGLLSTSSADTRYLKLDTSNGPLTGNLNISKSTPVLTLTDNSGAFSQLTHTSLTWNDGDFAMFTITPGTNSATLTFGSAAGSWGITSSGLIVSTGVGGGNAEDFSLKAASALGGSNLNGGSLLLKPGSATGNGTASTVIYATGGGSSGSGAQDPTAVATFGIATTTVSTALTVSGNVGIGTTSPYAKLSVAGQVVGAYFTATTTTASTFPNASTSLLTVSSAAYFPGAGIWNSTGNLGVGTTSPYAKLSVVGQVVGEYFTATSTTATSTFLGTLSVGSTTPTSTAMFSVGTSTPLLTVNKVNGAVSLPQNEHCAFLETDAGGDIDCASITSYKMDQIYARFTAEDAATFFIGDSTASGSDSPRWAQSIIRKWDVPWVGFVAGQFESSTPEEGYQTFNQVTPVARGGSFADGSGTNDTIFKFHEINATTGAFLSVRLNKLDTYFRGDWTKDKQIVARTILHKPAGSQSSSNTTINNLMSSGNDANYFNSPNLSITPTFDAVESSYATPNYVSNTYLDHRIFNYSVTSSVHSGAVEFYSPGKKGFSLWQAGIGSTHTYDWIHSSDDARGDYSSTQIQNSLNLVARKINTFILQLGINGSADESTADGGAVYKARIENIIDNWKADAEAAGGTDIKFLIINPWETVNDDPEWPVLRGKILLQIAHERDYVSFIDLNKLMLETYGENWQDTFLSDGIHQNTAGVNAIGDVTWKEISKGQNQMLWAASGREVFTNPGLTSGTSWSRTNDCALSSNAATCTFSAGTASTITQASSAFTTPVNAAKWYRFSYSVSGVSGTPAAYITTAFSDYQIPLSISAGNQTTYIKTAASPGNFIITTTLTSGQAFTLDNFSLQEAEDSNFVVNGSITGGGMSGIKITSSGDVGIGSTTPYARLTVQSTYGSSNPLFMVASSTSATTPASLTHFMIDRFGNVGVGTSTPFGKFSIHALTSDGDMSVPIFNVASSTASATTSLFTISRQGNVGIGTTSPYVKLSVVGDVIANNITATSTLTALDIVHSGSAWALTSGVGLRMGSARGLSWSSAGSYNGSVDVGLHRESAGVLAVNAGSVAGDAGGALKALYFTASSTTATSTFAGAVGISTSTPFGKFAIHALTSDTNLSVPILNIASSTASATTTLLTVSRSGNVGVGTSSPYAKLSVVGQVVADYFTATSSTASTFPYASTTAITVSGNAYFPNSSIWNSSGMIGLGTTTPNSNDFIAIRAPSVVHQVGKAFISMTAPNSVVDTKFGVEYFDYAVQSGVQVPDEYFNVFKRTGKTTADVNLSGTEFKFVNEFPYYNPGISATTTELYYELNNTRTGLSAIRNWGMEVILDTGKALTSFNNITKFAIATTTNSNSTVFRIDGTTSGQVYIEGNLNIGGAQVGTNNTASGITFANKTPTATLNTLYADTSANLTWSQGTSWQGASLFNTGNGGLTLAMSVKRTAQFDSGVSSQSAITAFGRAGQSVDILNIKNISGGTEVFNVGFAPDYKVGVGTTTPWAKFSVNASSTAPYFAVGSSTATHLMVSTAGNTGLGTTSPWRKLSVVGTVAFNGLTSSGTGNAVCIATSKDITDAGGGTCTPSASRFKENVETLSAGYAIEKLNQLRVVSFDYKDGFYSPEDAPESYGMIAEEVEEVDPFLVDYGYDGQPLTLKFEKILGLTVQAVQELSQQGGGLAANNFGINALLDALRNLGVEISEGIAKFTNVITKSLTVGSSEKPTGITLFDEATGKPYCLKIVSGKVKTVSGECETIPSSSNNQDQDDVDDNDNDNGGGGGGVIVPPVIIEETNSTNPVATDDEGGTVIDDNGGNTGAGDGGSDNTGDNTQGDSGDTDDSGSDSGGGSDGGSSGE